MKTCFIQAAALAWLIVYRLPCRRKGWEMDSCGSTTYFLFFFDRAMRIDKKEWVGKWMKSLGVFYPYCLAISGCNFLCLCIFYTCYTMCSKQTNKRFRSRLTWGKRGNSKIGQTAIAHGLSLGPPSCFAIWVPVGCSIRVLEKAWVLFDEVNPSNLRGDPAWPPGMRLRDFLKNQAPRISLLRHSGDVPEPPQLSLFD
jgi:hypothetical protein